MAYHLTCQNCDLDITAAWEVGLARFGDHQANYPEHHPVLVKEDRED